jgi:hypothetical protein
MTKPVIGVDLDEVLGDFVGQCNAWHNRTHGTSFQRADYTTYSFADVWNCGNSEVVDRVHTFFESEEFKNIAPIEGAKEVLLSLRAHFDFAVCTSRQTVISKETREWIGRFYPDIFSSVHLGNHYALSCPDPDDPGNSFVKKRTKPQMCSDINASVLIDDNVKYAVQCAQEDTMELIILFGNYGWNTGDANEASLKQLSAAQRGKIKRAADWTQVRQLLNVHLSSKGDSSQI